ncbi:MAG: hypothetical protein K1W06_06330 [Lachnospiraceae bacterium]
MLEYQRYGRNKDTIINSTYINSGEYRRKFDKITKNDAINRILYSKAKEMLFHRSGTLFEDMYWIDGDTGEVVAQALDEKVTEEVNYTKSIFNAVNGKTNLITMHTHPNSMPPSISDFNSCFNHGYAVCLVICHNGTIYQYISSQKVPSTLQYLYVQDFLKITYNERDAQIMALEKIKESYDINFREVI